MQMRSAENTPHFVPPLMEDDTWIPVKASSGLLDPPLRSRAASTGFIVEHGTLVGFASRPEMFAAYNFALDPNIESFREQYPRVAYRDAAGTWRQHTFDLFAVERRRRKLVAIKHSRRVERSGIWDTLKLIAAQIGTSVGDDVVLMTEKDFSPNERFNAEVVHETRRHQMPQHDDLVRKVTAEILGTVTIRDVVSMTGLGGDAFRAVVRLLADGHFRMSDAGARIDYPTRIYRA